MYVYTSLDQQCDEFKCLTNVDVINIIENNQKEGKCVRKIIKEGLKVAKSICTTVLYNMESDEVPYVLASEINNLKQYCSCSLYQKIKVYIKRRF